jgi:hypothetical protein
MDGCQKAAFLLVALILCHRCESYAVLGGPRAGASTILQQREVFRQKPGQVVLETPFSSPQRLPRSGRRVSRRESVASKSVQEPTLVPNIFCNSTPLHVDTKLVHGLLENGLEYYVLPHPVPSGRFEAHLAVLSGSIHEFDNQVSMPDLSLYMII